MNNQIPTTNLQQTSNSQIPTLVVSPRNMAKPDAPAKTVSPVLRLLADLVRIPSVNPAFPGGGSERPVADFLARWCRRKGIDASLQEVLPGRPNLIARLPGRNPARRIVFEAHTDTVAVEGMTVPPFEPTISGGLLYGRGACDTKGGLAAVLQAMATLRRDRILPPAEVWVAATADEEHEYRGVLRLCEGLRADAAVVIEPTEMRLVTASKGVLRFRIRCRGRAAHSSKPHLGVNAIAHMARVILALETDGAVASGPPHPLVGRPTLSVGTVRGGVQVNIVPDACVIEVDRRLIPGERAREVYRSVEALVARLQNELPELQATVEPPTLIDPPLETPAEAPVAALAARILRDLGRNGDPAGVAYGSDASKLAAAGVPSILFGPGSIDVAHTEAEHVPCAEVEGAVEFYRRMMVEFE